MHTYASPPASGGRGPVQFSREAVSVGVSLGHLLTVCPARAHP